jgi:hypothetical protein
LRTELLRVRVIGRYRENRVDLGQCFGKLPNCEERAREFDPGRQLRYPFGQFRDATAGEGLAATRSAAACTSSGHLTQQTQSYG